MSQDQNFPLRHRHVHLPGRDDFQSADFGQAERYRITRDAVLKHLADEAPVNCLFLQLDKKTNVLKLAKAVAKKNKKVPQNKKAPGIFPSDYSPARVPRLSVTASSAWCD